MKRSSPTPRSTGDADVVEREHQSLVLADEAPRREAGGKRPERGSQQAFDAPAKWGGKHMVEVSATQNVPATLREALREHSEEDTPVRRVPGPPARAAIPFRRNG